MLIVHEIGMALFFLSFLFVDFLCLISLLGVGKMCFDGSKWRVLFVNAKGEMGLD